MMVSTVTQTASRDDVLLLWQSNAPITHVMIGDFGQKGKATQRELQQIHFLCIAWNPLFPPLARVGERGVALHDFAEREHKDYDAAGDAIVIALNRDAHAGKFYRRALHRALDRD